MAVRTNQQLSATVHDSAFIDQASICAVKLARFIITDNTPGNQTPNRYFWAKGALQNARGAATTLLELIAIDPIIADQDPPAALTDLQVQQALENALGIALRF